MSAYELKTNATNRRIREIVTSVQDKVLIPRPDFQRRLVWTNKDRIAFIDTILQNMPFPEIYVCAGEVDPETARGTEWLVDGQQRVSTIVDYFTANKVLRLPAGIQPYARLSQEAKRNFLEYTVVVRDLGNVPVEYVKKVFERINSTKYGLNGMELANARWDGAIKKLAERLAEHAFYSDHTIFRQSDIKRMVDVSFQLTLLITMEQGYFDDTDEHEEYLKKYNDEYPHEASMVSRLEEVFDFINRLSLSPSGRWWKKADIFTLLVELDSAIHTRNLELVPEAVASALEAFDENLQRLGEHDPTLYSDARRETLARYEYAAAQGSNHRKSRVARGQIVAELLDTCATGRAG